MRKIQERALQKMEIIFLFVLKKCLEMNSLEASALYIN